MAPPTQRKTEKALRVSAIVRDFREQGDESRRVWGGQDLPPPYKYKREDVWVEIDPRDEIHYGGFLSWFYQELLKLKQTDFRHQCVVILGGQYMDCDVEYRMSNISLTEEGTPSELRDWFPEPDTVDAIYITVYTALRIRNEVFTRLSFTMSEHGWDEIADLL